MDAWTFIWLMIGLKIPIVALFLIVRWAVRQTPEEWTAEGEGGIGPNPGPLHPHHPRSRLLRSPRRGPHGDPPLVAPARVRTAVAHRRLTQR
ncbi:MAG TPA: hypothetical protein VFR48_08095 [Solirubrobacteraceae bacterium]|nr:hypothetical protein [Solirubrobacteraceae bacterium]